MASHQIDQREYADPDDIQRVPKQAPAQQTPQHGRSEPLNEYLGHQIDERDQPAGDVGAVRAYQGEEAGEKGAARGACVLRHHAGKFGSLYKQKGRTKQECEDCEGQEPRRLPPFGGQRPEPGCIARQQQTHRLDEDVADIEQLGSGRSAGGIPPQDCIGREQRREHDHVAEDENPESISDDDSLGSRAAAAAAARELCWNSDQWSVECRCNRHMGDLIDRTCSICAISAAEISSSRLMLQPATRTTMMAATKLRMANHQMCQISEKPKTVAKKAVTKPAGLLCGNSIAS